MSSAGDSDAPNASASAAAVCCGALSSSDRRYGDRPESPRYSPFVAPLRRPRSRPRRPPAAAGRSRRARPRPAACGSPNRTRSAPRLRRRPAGRGRRLSTGRRLCAAALRVVSHAAPCARRRSASCWAISSRRGSYSCAWRTYASDSFAAPSASILPECERIVVVGGPVIGHDHAHGHTVNTR